VDLDAGLPAESQKGLMCIPRPFGDIPHLQNNTLVLESVAKTWMIDSSHVTEDPFDSLNSGTAHVTRWAPCRGQALSRSSTLNTSATVSSFLSSVQSVSKISVRFVAPTVGARPCGSYNIPLKVWLSLP